MHFQPVAAAFLVRRFLFQQDDGLSVSTVNTTLNEEAACACFTPHCLTSSFLIPRHGIAGQVIWSGGDTDIQTQKETQSRERTSCIQNLNIDDIREQTQETVSSSHPLQQLCTWNRFIRVPHRNVTPEALRTSWCEKDPRLENYYYY